MVYQGGDIKHIDGVPRGVTSNTLMVYQGGDNNHIVHGCISVGVVLLFIMIMICLIWQCIGQWRHISCSVLAFMVN